MAELFGFDCYSPRETAGRVETVGVTKANLPFTSMVAAGMIALEELRKWILRGFEVSSD